MKKFDVVTRHPGEEPVVRMTLKAVYGRDSLIQHRAEYAAREAFDSDPTLSLAWVEDAIGRLVGDYHVRAPQ